jgi:TPR repeat protein/serine/threonine protein kinase
MFLRHQYIVKMHRYDVSNETSFSRILDPCPQHKCFMEFHSRFVPETNIDTDRRILLRAHMSHIPLKPDTDVSDCFVCTKQFGILRAKSHCRACGEVICKSCLPSKIVVSGYDKPQHACLNCCRNAALKDEDPSWVPSSEEAARLQELCRSFESQMMSVNTSNVAKVAVCVMNQAQSMTVAPFSTLFFVTSTALTLSITAATNATECSRLADRIARISFAVLQLTARKETFVGASGIAKELLSALKAGVALLQEFQPVSKGKVSFVDMLQSKMALYSFCYVELFDNIHRKLTTVIQDRAFMISVAEQELLKPPSLDEIQGGIHSEVSHVLAELQRHSMEGDTRFDHIDAQLQEVLRALSTGHGHGHGHAGGKGKDVTIIDPHSLQVDTQCVLGRGASGVVYAGTLYGTTQVAVKVLSGTSTGSGGGSSDDDVSAAGASASASFEALHCELQRTVRVAHRNVIQVYGAVRSCSLGVPASDGSSVVYVCRPAVVTERMGSTLEPVLGKLGPSQATKLTLDIIRGMARVHDREGGVVHFDLKPENVLLSVDGRTAVISDFGIAQSKTTVAFASSSENALMRGTVAYMAPEIFLGTSRGFPCDVYSFAMLLYALWSGRAPWQGCSDSTIIAAVKEGSRPATDIDMISWGVPEPIVAMIVACWQQSPSSRPSFRMLMELEDIDMLWEAPVARWPSYLFSSATSLAGSESGRSTSSWTMSASEVGHFTCDRLCTYLVEVHDIHETIINWLREKKINGDVFLASGPKLMERLRQSADPGAGVDDWHIEALERCHSKLRDAVNAEAARQQQLSAARKAAAAVAAAIAPAKSLGFTTALQGLASSEPPGGTFAPSNQREDSLSVSEEISSRFTKTVEIAPDTLEILRYHNKADKGDVDAQLRLGLSYLNGLGVPMDETTGVRWLHKAADQDCVEAFVLLGACYSDGVGVAKDEAAGVSWFRKAADTGDARAQYYLGTFYFNGSGVAKDEVKAVEWYHKAADQGEARAQYQLGRCYLLETGVAKDDTKAVEWFRKAADQGYSKSQSNLGRCYAQGIGVALDQAEAVGWYKKAAVQGEIGAQYFLGKCFANGTGVTKNEAEAVNWFRKSADQGHAASQYAMGLHCAKGNGVPMNKSEAVRWYRKAADQGHANAQYHVGRCYSNGEGLMKDETAAVSWHRKAAEQGHAAAQADLGYCYCHGLGVRKDASKGAEWNRKAADQGNVTAQIHLGISYLQGQGVAKNTATAVSWFRKAADQDNANAMCFLGLCYAEACGVAQDDASAAEWFGKAAEKGCADAQCSLGVCYAYGKGLAKDEVKAVEWFRKAADQGYPGAQYQLGVCYSDGISVTKDYTEAVVWLSKAADQGHLDAQVLLAWCYSQGEGVTKDETAAARWYREAANRGHADAQTRLKQLLCA